MDDLLIRFDLATERDRIALMREVMEDEAMAQSCARLASDRRRRALAELRFTGALGYNDYRLLEKEGMVCMESYRLRHPDTPPGMDFADIFILSKGWDFLTDITGLPDGMDPYMFYEIHIDDYMARSRRDGIVANRNAMEAAVAIADTAFLRLVRSPETGAGARYAWGNQWNDLLERTPSDIEAARKADRATYVSRVSAGTVLHDISGLPGPDTNQWDASIRPIDLPKWFAMNIFLIDEEPREIRRREREWAKLPDWDAW